MKTFFLKKKKYQFSHLFLYLFLIPLFFPTKKNYKKFIIFTNLPLISSSSTIHKQFTLLTLQLYINTPNSIQPIIH